MAFWCRIKQSKLKCFSHQFKRCYLQTPYSSSVNYTTSHTRFRFIEKPDWVVPKKPTEFCYNSRFFAAPVQAKPKQEEKDTSGPRLNDKIMAQFVRLVTEEGHYVVSRNEALERARKLKLDLVEVQRTAEPPVCKIMDFNREKYKQQLKEKERAKSKSEVTLKKGDCKEVRVSMKTEQKDLQIKADTVKRLMERGYRVKCMVMGTEDQDLGGMLARLSALIEDVSIVESGPRVEKKQAYVLVRHIKFGPSKKGPGKKASKVVGVSSTEAQNTATVPPTANPSSIPIQFEEDLNSEESGLETDDEILSDEADMPVSPSMGMPDINLEENKTTWSVSNASDDFEKVFDFSDDVKGVTSNSTLREMNTAPETAFASENTNSPFLHPKPVLDSMRVNTAPFSSPELPLPTENRYRRNEPRNRIPPTKATENKGTGSTDSVRLGPQFPSLGRLPQSDLNALPSTGEPKRVGTDASVFPPNEIFKQGQSRYSPPSSARPSFGAFSAPKANVLGQNGVSAEVKCKEGNSFDSTAPVRSEPQLPRQGMQQKYGLNVPPSTKHVGTDGSIFRNLKVPTNEVPKQEESRPGPPTSAAPSYGIFSAPKANAPRRQGGTAGS
ncbi:hypothetical protein L1049_014566 [Liquidambar formosana]|uniref:Translation initiation factor 3 N-terminal domain-containing protein n=1 Tax=Liquidambar formosana TaxID=63359 RepID=A0AAP0RXD6_LIQFO